MVIVAFLERGDGDAHRLDISEDAAVDRLLLQLPVEALGHPVGLGLGDEREAWRDAPELGRVEEIVGGVLRTVVHAQCQPAPGIGAGGAKIAVQALGDWLQGGEALANLDRMDADTTGIAMIDGREHPDPAFIDGLDTNAVGAPHLVRAIRVDDRPVVQHRPPWGRRWRESNWFSRIRRSTRARETRMAARRSSSDTFGFGPRRAGSSATTLAACRWAQLVERGNSSTRQTRSRP